LAYLPKQQCKLLMPLPKQYNIPFTKLEWPRSPAMTSVQKLIRLIEQRSMTQGEVETAVRLPQGRISKWVAGQGEPSLRQGLRLARWFTVPVEWLADDTLDELPIEEVSGDLLRTITAIIALLGAQEALRRLLLMSGDPSGLRGVAAGDLRAATRENPATVVRTSQRIIATEEGPDETEPRQPAAGTTPSEVATGHQQVATPEDLGRVVPKRRQRTIDT
jgi:transcriptional regulator with XRE-family HTH domain